jgi:hypothetical protein
MTTNRRDLRCARLVLLTELVFKSSPEAEEGNHVDLTLGKKDARPFGPGNRQGTTIPAFRRQIIKAKNKIVELTRREIRATGDSHENDPEPLMVLRGTCPSFQGVKDYFNKSGLDGSPIMRRYRKLYKKMLVGDTRDTKEWSQDMSKSYKAKLLSVVKHASAGSCVSVKALLRADEPRQKKLQQLRSRDAKRAGRVQGTVKLEPGVEPDVESGVQQEDSEASPTTARDLSAELAQARALIAKLEASAANPSASRSVSKPLSREGSDADERGHPGKPAAGKRPPSSGVLRLASY